jgi:hypothetical protein
VGRTVTLAVDSPIRLEVGLESVVLQPAELDRLIGALGRVEADGADAVREQIAALRLVGRVIDLSPTESELEALRLALAVLVDDEEALSETLLALVEICAPSEETEA